jgi:hypothetical protein
LSPHFERHRYHSTLRRVFREAIAAWPPEQTAIRKNSL